MATAVGGGTGVGGGQERFAKGIMGHEVIKFLKAASGDKALFRQCPTAVGQANVVQEVMVHRMAKIDLGNDLETIVIGLRSDYGAAFQETSGDIWKVLIDKEEAEANDKIKRIHQGEGLRAYGVVSRWFTDVSGWGLSETSRCSCTQTRRRGSRR